FNTIAVFVYGFLFIIALITVFNIFNIMNTSVSSRINQYGIMRAVGMSRRQLQKMIIVESGVYSIFGCITGILFGIPLNVLLFRQMITNIWGLPWKFPIIPLLIIIILSLLATLISTLSPVRKIQEMDIVNVINQ
ncbi:MAG: FtsX-like permease family protein, partial [Eubacterium sp.]